MPAHYHGETLPHAPRTGAGVWVERVVPYSPASLHRVLPDVGFGHEGQAEAMFTASARSIGGTLRHEVDVNGRHTMITDEPERLGGTDVGPAPHELMAAMLAACASTMIVLYAQRRDWHLGDVRVDVSYDADVTPRRVDIEVHLPEGLRPEQIERLRRVADTCPARRALEAGFTFDERLDIDLSAGAG